jgi:hypothetical protein
VKIFKPDEYFEAKATVLYANSTLGMGLAFRDVERDFRAVIQKWLLAAMQDKGVSLKSQLVVGSSTGRCNTI